ncbi:MFS transporter [Sinosporangium siamense]|uniref:Major facilitator superfamily (MFS) profile domain-containing protein n=1 Tax=Sinosporangium siamense TaxID=1367973 RepID=A0A919RFP5_9ACTN|nr:hypothetical protein Ssi02_27630 [Sinosporangium siamense]
MSVTGRYLLVSFLTWLSPGLTVAAMVLLMGARGQSIAVIGGLLAVYSVVVIVLELPTGGLADVWGRRVVLAAAAGFGAAGALVMAFASSFWGFLGAMVFMGVGRALSSGPAEAWFVDALQAEKGEGVDLRPGLARGRTMDAVGVCLGTLVGGTVPLFVPREASVALAVPMVLGAAASGVLLVVALMVMTEARRERAKFGEVMRAVPYTVGMGVRLAGVDGVLRRLMGVKVAIGVVLGGVELLTPGMVLQLTGRPTLAGTVYAVIAALGFVGSGLGSFVTPWAARRVGGSRQGVRGAVVGGLGACLGIGGVAAAGVLGEVAGLVAAALAYVVLFAGLAMLQVLCAEMLHHRVTSGERATVMSAQSLSLQVGGVCASVALGALAAGVGTAGAFLASTSVMCLSLLLFVRVPFSRGREGHPSPGQVPLAQPGSD